MPRRRAVRMIRQAISPRLAMRMVLNIAREISAVGFAPTNNTLSWPGLSRTSPAMTRRRSSISVPSHPENSELGLLDRRIEACRDGQRQQAAGVDRIDDAVVPQARAGII